VKALVAIVEDNVAVRDALATILVLEGYSVRTYASGEVFMRSARNKRQPDCVLLDLFMPDGSGADVLEVLDTASTPVIVISAEENGQQALAAIKAGACDFIKKPFDADMVLERVQFALALCSAGARRRRPLPDHHQK
jgi:two-component system, LuxR family, response regulator FixJ